MKPMTFSNVDSVTRARIIQLQGELGPKKNRSDALRVAMEAYYKED